MVINQNTIQKNNHNTISHDHSAHPIQSGPQDNTVKMIYESDGINNIIPGAKWFKESDPQWPMSGGGSRASTRLIYYKVRDHNGDQVGGCIDYHDLEVTAYVKIGDASEHRQGEARCIITTGGPGQHDDCCCVYSIGFTQEGKAYAEEEGPHSPHPTIFKMDVVGGDHDVQNIGPLKNRTVGLKSIIYHDSDHNTQLEGYVDKDNNNNWKCFYKAVNPHGGDLPVITKVPMAGNDHCQEMRVRYDNHWPVDLVPEKSSIRKIVPPA